MGLQGIMKTLSECSSLPTGSLMSVSAALHNSEFLDAGLNTLRTGLHRQKRKEKTTPFGID